MRVFSRVLLVLSLLASVAAPSGAIAAALGYQGTLAVQIGGLPPLLLTGTGVAIVNGSGGGSHLGSLSLPAGAFMTTGQVLSVTDTAYFPIEGLQLTAVNGTAGFFGAPLAGFMPLFGVAKVCLFGDCSAAVANISVPLSVVGVGGVSWVKAAVNLTVTGAPWTTGVANAYGVTVMGYAHGPASGTSSTAAPSGVATLVTPILISTNIGGSQAIPAFGILALHFVPEPGTLGLLTGGLVALVAFGRRLQEQQRSRSDGDV